MTTEATLYIAGDLVTNLGKSLSLRTTTPELNISSLPKLNDKIFGLPKRKLTIIAARPSHGKTSFMSQIAKDLAMAGKKTLILSYEESKEQLMERLFCNMAKVPNRDIQRGLFYKYEDMFEDWAKHMKKIPLALTDCGDKDCRALALVLDTMPVDLRPDVIFVDYIQAIKGLGSLQQGNERSMLDEYIKHFRKMAAHYNFAGVLMSQINRSTELVRSKDQGPKIHQLKGTGFLEEHAYLVLLIHWLYKTTGKQSDYHHPPRYRAIFSTGLHLEPGRGSRMIPLHRVALAGSAD